MSFTARILNNRHAVWAAVIATFITGVVAYQAIPVRLFPDTAPPLVNVVTPWPGATAADVAQDLSRLLEEEFASLEGVEAIRATSQDNLSMISVEFVYGTVVDLAAVDIQNALTTISEDMPEGAEQPRVMTFSTADRPVYSVGIAADDLVQARRLAEDVIAPRLQQVPGVSAVDVFGGSEPTVLVDVDPRLAETHRLPLQRVAAAIGGNNVSAPAGRLRGSSTETMLRIDSRPLQAEELSEVPLQLPDGAQLQVGDVSTVSRGALDDDSWFSIDSRQAIAVQVFRAEDANTVAVVRAVQEQVAGLEAAMPELDFLAGEETASFTELSVSNLLSSVWQALLLASVILFLFLGRARSAAITILSMPLSYGLTFAVMAGLGMEFNMVTLSAVILAVGMVVDASVVVLENIVRLREEEGLAPLEAAIRGADEVRAPVLAGVATTLMVLIPLLNLRGFIGKVFAPLATTLLIAFSTSVLVALVVVPVLSIYARDGGRIDAVAGRIAAPFQWAMDRVRGGYLAMLGFGLRRPTVVLLIAVLTFAGGLVGLRKAGMDVLPRMDSGAFSVSLQTPSGTSLKDTSDVVRQVQELISIHPEVLLVQSQAGYEAGMLFTGAGGVMGPTQGYLSVTLSDRTDREASIWEIEERIRAQVARVPGIARSTVKEVGNTAKPTTVAPIVVRLTGADPRVLDVLGDQVIDAITGVPALVEPTRSWHRDLSRVMVRVDEREAASLNQSPLGVARLLAMGAEGMPAGNFTFPDGTTEPVRVRYARSADPTVDELLAWPLFLESGQVLPLRSLAKAERVVEQGLFTRQDLRSTLDVTAQVDGRPLSFVVADAQVALDGLLLPDGYSVKLEGENKDLIESRKEILRAFAISVLAVYLLLVAQFRSFVHPLTVMAAVPLSISGVSAALWLAGKPVSMPVMIGLVLLVGTVVNNSIILVDVIRQLRDEGVERSEAIAQGVRTRFRPILMTSLSTIVGMIPLSMEWALGSERFSPLATAVIGGLLASTLLTLVVIPVLYDTADRISLRVRRPAQVLAAGLALVALSSVTAPQIAMAQEAPGPTTIEQAWELAREGNPGLARAGHLVDAAVAGRDAATGRLLPQLELQARYTRVNHVDAPLLEIPITMPNGDTPDPMELGEAVDDRVSLRATATQPVFAGGALFEGRRASIASLRRAEAERAVTEGTLWERLAEAWYGRVLSHEMVVVQERVVVAAQAQMQRIDRLLERGRSTDLARSRVALSLAEAEQALADARSRAALADHAVEVLVGATAGSADVDLLVLAREYATIEETERGRSARLRSAEAGLGAVQAKARATTGLMAPAIGLRFGAQYENPNSRYFPLEAEWNPSWDASVVLTWNIDVGVRLGQSRAARADARAAQAGLEGLEDEQELVEAQLLTLLEQSAGDLALADQRVELAEHAVEVVARAVEAGRAPAIELIDRETDRARAEAARLMVSLDRVLAHERLRVLGGDWGPR
jgi:multidrug efflux pump subunit AcrB/outer membrane protein TolC